MKLRPPQKERDIQVEPQGFFSGSGLIPYPGNILSDISRLEVLIGGKQAGNNSPEIINEAADICRPLFQCGIMDIGVYRELIDELVEDHIDAYGYYSD